MSQAYIAQSIPRRFDCAVIEVMERSSNTSTRQWKSNRRGGRGNREKHAARSRSVPRALLVPAAHGLHRLVSRKHSKHRLSHPVSPSAAMMTPPAKRRMHSAIWTCGPLTTMPPRSSSTVTCSTFAGKVRTANQTLNIGTGTIAYTGGIISAGRVTAHRQPIASCLQPLIYRYVAID